MNWEHVTTRCNSSSRPSGNWIHQRRRPLRSLEMTIKPVRTKRRRMLQQLVSPPGKRKNLRWPKSLTSSVNRTRMNELFWSVRIMRSALVWLKTLNSTTRRLSVWSKKSWTRIWSTSKSLRSWLSSARRSRNTSRIAHHSWKPREEKRKNKAKANNELVSPQQQQLSNDIVICSLQAYLNFNFLSNR